VVGSDKRGWKIIEVDPSPEPTMLIVTICGKRLALVSQKGRVLRVHVNPDKDCPDGWVPVNPDTDGPDAWNGGLFQVWSPALLPRGGGQAFVEFAEYHLDNGEKLTLIADANFNYNPPFKRPFKREGNMRL